MADDIHFMPAERQFLAAIQTDDFVRRIKSSRRTLAVNVGEGRGPESCRQRNTFLIRVAISCSSRVIWSLLLTGG